MKTFLLAALVAGALPSCAHFGPAPAGPEAAARAYADALEQNRLDAAREHSTGLDAARFAQAYGSAEVRAKRAAAVRAAADGQGSDLKLVLEGGTWRVQELEPAHPEVQQQAAQALVQFLDAAEGRDFERALSLLGASLRGRYTVQRLAEDFDREPLAPDRLARARTALAQGGWIMAADGAQLPVGAGHAVRLSRETEGWRVVALE
ncbi:MAG: hypothetical protein IPJ65_09790 [Archangiaceae bacterium]|nr:hypothetical protein [Archangiaceae bacterium]